MMHCTLDSQEYQRENEAEERRCLEITQHLLHKYKYEKGAPVAAVIVEPIQAEGGMSGKGRASFVLFSSSTLTQVIYGR